MRKKEVKIMKKISPAVIALCALSLVIILTACRSDKLTEDLGRLKAKNKSKIYKKAFKILQKLP